MNRVEWELYGQTNVDQVTDKTNKGLDGVDKNAKRVGDSFAMSASSIFLKFLGPMALLTAAISFIGKLIEDNKRKHEEANKAAVDGTNELMSAEDQYYSRKKENAKKDKEDKEQAKTVREEVTKDFLLKDPRGRKILNETLGMKHGAGESASSTVSSRDVKIQEQVQALIAEDMMNDPNSKFKREFKAPEGFSNVVGVGANPVLEAVTQQLEVQRQMLTQLEVANAGKTNNTDFTKPTK